MTFSSGASRSQSAFSFYDGTVTLENINWHLEKAKMIEAGDDSRRPPDSDTGVRHSAVHLHRLRADVRAKRRRGRSILGRWPKRWYSRSSVPSSCSLAHPCLDHGLLSVARGPAGHHEGAGDSHRTCCPRAASSIAQSALVTPGAYSRRASLSFANATARCSALALGRPRRCSSPVSWLWRCCSRLASPQFLGQNFFPPLRFRSNPHACPCPDLGPVSRRRRWFATSWNGPYAASSRPPRSITSSTTSGSRSVDTLNMAYQQHRHQRAGGCRRANLAQGYECRAHCYPTSSSC